MSAEADNVPPSIPAAYVGVIAIWSTTPLGIKWSAEAGVLFGVSARMVIAAVLLTLVLFATRQRLPMHAAALRSYAISTLGIFGAMTAVYWASRALPSGLLAVVFGLAPVITALLSVLLLHETRRLGWQLGGGGLGAIGLAIVFSGDTAVSAGWGVPLLVTLLGATLYSISAVWIKREAAEVSAMALATGGLLASVPLFLLSWAVSGELMPTEVPTRTWGAILYLAVFGSMLGFVWYYHLLRHLPPSSVALITLVTPVTALGIGALLNDEQLPLTVWWGVAVILAGLAVFVFGGLRWQRPERTPL